MRYSNWILIALICVGLVMAGCSPVANTSATAPANAADVDLSGIKTYLVEKAQALKSSTTSLKEQSDNYYKLAEASGFDYAALWNEQADEVTAILGQARENWLAASPLYEKMEGIVAGVSVLADYDIILDAGASGADDPENAVPFDLTLPDGRVLPKPGNLFGVSESTLWGTDPAYNIGDVQADWNGNGEIEFAENLPDANVLKAVADALDQSAGELLASAEQWQPTLTDAFSALIIMTPTMSEYFASWRDSRFVSGDASTQRDFVAISRLSDIQDILSGLDVVYQQVQPQVTTVDAGQASQIAASLTELRAFVTDVYQQEQDGKRFSPEEADLLGAEAQNRATTLTGRISQVAAQLGIEVNE